MGVMLAFFFFVWNEEYVKHRERIISGRTLLRIESKWKDTSKMAGNSIFCDIEGTMYQ